MGYKKRKLWKNKSCGRLLKNLLPIFLEKFFLRHKNASELVPVEECFSRDSKKFFSFSIPYLFSSKAKLCELLSLVD